MADAREKSDAEWDSLIRELSGTIHAPLYLRLARSIRNDPELRRLAALAQPGQPEPNMIFGAVHFLLLKGGDHRLRGFYPNLSTEVDTGDPFPPFREFCLANRDAVAHLISSRITNTNEVARSGLLYAGFVELVRRAPQVLHLVEIGPSAGLNLYWDRYGYRYSSNGDILAAGATDASLIIEVMLRGERLPPLAPTPRVATRVGLERRPVDLSKPDERQWLKALVWPDHEKRFRRLDLALTANATWSHDIRRGDALHLLPDALASAPENETLCVYHTLAVYQFSSEMKEAFETLLIRQSTRRPIWRLSLEEDDERIPLILSCYSNGGVTSHRLAHCEGHGKWMEWLV